MSAGVRHEEAICLDDSTRIPFPAVPCERGVSGVRTELDPQARVAG